MFPHCLQSGKSFLPLHPVSAGGGKVEAANTGFTDREKERKTSLRALRKRKNFVPLQPASEGGRETERKKEAGK
ncbi:hypothetical protein DXT99_15835 [Pontibacter diazotrophicus]|uniref:Uncharacterized protein n=1 Tax=Pontibacter diazotrophicus TaxID=1400979 RepID=A0A3D8L9M0_9BACT|nr:hypothetical protein DXT99_15835 [Pontibacter diazotrophicus]